MFPRETELRFRFFPSKISTRYVCTMCTVYFRRRLYTHFEIEIGNLSCENSGYLTTIPASHQNFKHRKRLLKTSHITSAGTRRSQTLLSHFHPNHPIYINMILSKTAFFFLATVATVSAFSPASPSTTSVSSSSSKTMPGRVNLEIKRGSLLPITYFPSRAIERRSNGTFIFETS